MKVIVRDIIKDIKDNPNQWNPLKSGGENYYTGIQKGDIEISGMGNTKLLSVIRIHIDGSMLLEVAYFDNWRLEAAVLKWYKQAKINQLTKAII